MNPLCLDPEDRCPQCGTNLRTTFGVRVACPIGHEGEPEDAA